MENGKNYLKELSLKENETLQWLTRGYSNKDIAAKMEISIVGVKSHIKNIYAKLTKPKYNE